MEAVTVIGKMVESIHKQIYMKLENWERYFWLFSIKSYDDDTDHNAITHSESQKNCFF